MQHRYMPGTTLEYDKRLGKNLFASVSALCRASGGLSLSQVSRITGLEPTTIQNWIKRGWVSRTVDKKYSEYQLARIILINTLRESLPLERIALILTAVNGDVDDLSDDIIDEGELYNRFCSVITCEDDRVLSPDEVRLAVSRELEDYRSDQPDSGLRLNNALVVMALAYEASRLARLANSALTEWLGE